MTNSAKVAVCVLGHKRKSFECPACATQPMERRAWHWYRSRTSSKRVKDALAAILREHSPATLNHPTIFNPEKVAATCSCGWRGPWHPFSDPITKDDEFNIHWMTAMYGENGLIAVQKGDHAE